MSDLTHSPLPWVIASGTVVADVHEAVVTDTNVYPTFADETQRQRDVANAEFIVRAVNCHHEMLSALKALVAAIEDDGTLLREGVTGATYSVTLNDRGCNWADVFNAAEAAIAKAEGRA